MLVTNELPVDFSMLSARVKEFFSQNGCSPELEARLWELDGRRYFKPGGRGGPGKRLSVAIKGSGEAF